MRDRAAFYQAHAAAQNASVFAFRRGLVPSAGPLLALLVVVGQPHQLVAQTIRGS